MITGTVIGGLEAVVDLTISGPSGQAKTLKAVIDTGFTGSLVLPAEVVETLGLPSHGIRKGELADGSMGIFKIFRGTVDWNGTPRKVQVLEAKGGALVGMAMLQGTRVVVEAIDGGIVSISSLE